MFLLHKEFAPSNLPGNNVQLYKHHLQELRMLSQPHNNILHCKIRLEQSNWSCYNNNRPYMLYTGQRIAIKYSMKMYQPGKQLVPVTLKDSNTQLDMDLQSQ